MDQTKWEDALKSLRHVLQVNRQRAMDHIIGEIRSYSSTHDPVALTLFARCAAECQHLYDSGMEVESAEQESDNQKEIAHEDFRITSSNYWILFSSCMTFASALLRCARDCGEQMVGETKDFVRKCYEWGELFYKHPEYRVRNACAVLLGGLASFDGLAMWMHFRELIFEAIESDFERQNADLVGELKRESADSGEKVQLSEEEKKRRHLAVMHDTEGWKSLETTFVCLQHIVTECRVESYKEYVLAFFFGYKSNDYDEDSRIDVFDWLVRGAQHLNRFVRESSYRTFAAMCREKDVINTLLGMKDQFDVVSVVNQLAVLMELGLSDNWSQVRMAANTAVRKYLLSMGVDHLRQFNVLPRIVPGLCLNRYYVAQGVRLYAQETWKRVFVDSGPAVVAETIDAVVPYYIRQCDADNHAVREAACHCVAELGRKVSRDAVLPHVHKLLSALNNCFCDESWPVRDAACIACAMFVTSFLELCLSDDSLYACVSKELMKLWIDHLSDNLPSVRETSAISLAKVVGSLMKYSGEEHRDRAQALIDAALSCIIDGLKAVKNQPKDSKRFPNLANVTQFGVAGPASGDSGRDSPNPHAGHDHSGHDHSAHDQTEHGATVVSENESYEYGSNQQMYSCGSLAPKLKRGRAGCMDHGFTRPKQPWETTDGTIKYVRELAPVQQIARDKYDNWLFYVVEAAHARGFRHSFMLERTVLHCVVPIMDGITPKRFKNTHLEEFLPILFHGLQSTHALTRHAAIHAVREIRSRIGKTIFEGRLTSSQKKIYNSCQDLAVAQAPNEHFDESAPWSKNHGGAVAAAASIEKASAIPPNMAAAVERIGMDQMHPAIRAALMRQQGK